MIALSKMLLAVVALSAGCGGNIANQGQVPLNEVASVRLLHSEVALPASAANVWINEQTFQDSYQMLRFDASEADARAFVRSVLGRDTIRGEDPHFGEFGRGHDWWLRDYPADAEGGSSRERHPAVKVVLLPMGDRARIWMLSLTA